MARRRVWILRPLAVRPMLWVPPCCRGRLPPDVLLRDAPVALEDAPRGHGSQPPAGDLGVQAEQVARVHDRAAHQEGREGSGSKVRAGHAPLPQRLLWKRKGAARAGRRVRRGPAGVEHGRACAPHEEKARREGRLRVRARAARRDDGQARWLGCYRMSHGRGAGDQPRGSGARRLA